MLSRHFLRAKALQTIYAGVSSKSVNEDEIVKMFDYNVQRLNDLGILQLSTLPQLTFSDEKIMEAAMQKFNPSEAEINPNRRFAENKLICRLSDSFEYKQLCNRMNIDWSDNFDVFRKILSSIKASKQYAEYISLPDSSFEDDKAFALIAFKFLMNDDTLRALIYDKDLLWEDDFDQVAQYNFMMIKELIEENTNEAMQCPQIYDKRNTKDCLDYDFARQLVLDTIRHLDDTEPMIRKHLQNWDMDRVALMDILLINMAVTEFTCCPSIPERVTVDEYIELSKEFSTEKSKLFINGILDKILIELRVAGRIEKDERGLYDPQLENYNTEQ
ncbi:MAG: transcription antitermination factor NusB [Bacteroidales bacterium]|nr:transcription antitermination factor NusB [Bacteroidales bacterium]